MGTEVGTGLFPYTARKNIYIVGKRSYIIQNQSYIT